ncbi:MAG TPA: InlB B-repeat-containing protein [Kofleriaceae bacterium]|nr:InlB B-repeat-containing protein [Kofleriaceae bacterium]
MRYLAVGLACLFAACGNVKPTQFDAPPEMVTLTVTRSGNATGSVSSTPAGITCGATCSMQVVAGTQVTLTATADANATFGGWNGGGCSGTGTCAITVDANTMVDAAFTKEQFTVVITPNGDGAGTVTSTPAGITCGATCSSKFDVGTQVTLHAAADSGSTFLGWSGGGCSGTADCTITVSADVGVQAAFGKNGSLVVTLAGNGSGSVASNDGNINCGSACSHNYPPNSTVTLTASPAAGSSFTGWAGGGCSGTGTCTVTINQATGVTATFTLKQFTLTVNKSGTGAANGTVTSTDSTINCGTSCTATHNYGDTVTLDASAPAGTTFAGWSGGGCSGAGSCSVTITAATTVTATFTIDQVTLTVSKPGNGSGTVTSNVGGINCGGTCSATVNYGTSVTLTASAAGGSTFSGWSGGGCSGAGTCTVSVTAATTVSATFTLNQYTLTVSKTGSGGGTVTSNVGGINCGTTCSATFNYGTQVTLTAMPVVGSSFTGWSGGGCSGAGTCTTTVLAATTVTATFTKGCTNQTVTLNPTQSVSIQYPNAGGTVYRDNSTRAYSNPNADCGGGPPCDITGWYEFDLSNIPDSSSIVSMSLSAYANTVQMGPTVRLQYSAGNNWTRAAVLQSDLPRTNAQIAPPISPTVAAYNTFTIDLSSQSFAADLIDNSLTIGVDNTNAAYSYAYFDGSDASGKVPTLTITYCN